jgi:hypothetical protein
MYVCIYVYIYNYRKPAQTYFSSLATSGLPDGTVHSLVLCEPVTGRTHQIRLHLQWLGCPIANDPLYGPSGVGSTAIPAIPAHAHAQGAGKGDGAGNSSAGGWGGEGGEDEGGGASASPILDSGAGGSVGGESADGGGEYEGVGGGKGRGGGGEESSAAGLKRQKEVGGGGGSDGGVDVGENGMQGGKRLKRVRSRVDLVTEVP